MQESREQPIRTGHRGHITGRIITVRHRHGISISTGHRAIIIPFRHPAAGQVPQDPLRQALHGPDLRRGPHQDHHGPDLRQDLRHRDPEA